MFLCCSVVAVHLTMTVAMLFKPWSSLMSSCLRSEAVFLVANLNQDSVQLSPARFSLTQPCTQPAHAHMNRLHTHGACMHSSNLVCKSEGYWKFLLFLRVPDLTVEICKITSWCIFCSVFCEFSNCLTYVKPGFPLILNVSKKTEYSLVFPVHILWTYFCMSSNTILF